MNDLDSSNRDNYPEELHTEELDDPQPKSIVEVRQAYKRYSSNTVVLKGLNMTVQRGTIYGLLGPSGCGKTTLLSCITGRKILDSGNILVYIDSKIQLGYMPQEVALFPELTILEMFTFYGKLLGISPYDTINVSNRLLSFLELPPNDRIIGSLSGGQQRRVSLALTLLHSPQLLILDEPTVGVDPVLCKRIWEYFLEITNTEKKTIIITTHYIEEARNCHMIGLMREAVLLAESPPTSLMVKYNFDTLEDVFLHLSQKQQNEQTKLIQEYPRPKEVPAKPFSNEKLFDLGRFKAQTYKNIQWTKRNIPITLFILGLPALLLVIFCSVFGSELNGFTLGVIIKELPNCSDSSLNNTVLDCNNPDRFSCRYLNTLREMSYEIVEYDDLEISMKHLYKNKVKLVMLFPENYSVSLLERINKESSTNDSILDAGTIIIWQDMSDPIVGYKVRRDITFSLEKFFKSVYEACGYNPNAAGIPLKVHNPIYSLREPIFSHSSLPGYICPLCFYLTFMFTSSAVMMEKSIGILERSFVAGLTMFEVLAAHILVQVLIMVCQDIVILSVLYIMFTNPLEGSILMCASMLLLVESLGISYGLLLTQIISSETNVTYIGIGTVLGLFMLGGMIWPLEGIHWSLQPLAYYSPITMAVESYRSVTIKGWGLHSPLIYKTIGANILTICILLVIYFALMKYRKEI